MEQMVIALSIMVCFGIVISMAVKMRSPKKSNEGYAEVIKKNQFVDPKYKENGIYVSKVLYSITFIMDEEKRSFYCKEGFFDSIEVGDKVKIVHDGRKIIDIQQVK